MTTENNANESVTVRDVLAGQALTGLLTSPARPGVPAMNMVEMAAAAYRYADAMLLAREKKA